MTIMITPRTTSIDSSRARCEVAIALGATVDARVTNFVKPPLVSSVRDCPLGMHSDPCSFEIRSAVDPIQEERYADASQEAEKTDEDVPPRRQPILSQSGWKENDHA